METPNTIIEFLVFLLPPVMVAVTAYLLIQRFLQREQQLKVLELKMVNQKDLLPLRLQAYERLAIYLERISPNQMLLNQYEPGFTVAQFQRVLVAMVRDEFEHNLAQQIYVSAALWTIIRNTKEDVVRQINSAAATLDPEAPCHELSQAVFNAILEREDFGTQKTLSILKAEVAQLF
jgi:hypothetical protein